MLKMELIKEDIQKLTKNLSSDSDLILLLNELNKDLFSKEPTPLFTKKQIGFVAIIDWYMLPLIV